MPVASGQQEGKRALPATAAALRLARARALVQLGRLDDASIILQRLSGACTHETRHGLSYCGWGDSSSLACHDTPRRSCKAHVLMLMQVLLLWLPCAGTADVRLADPLSSGGGGATLAQQRLRAAAALDAACGDWAAVAARLQDTAAVADAPHWATGGYGWAKLQQGSVEVGPRKNAPDGKTSAWGRSVQYVRVRIR